MFGYRKHIGGKLREYKGRLKSIQCRKIYERSGSQVRYINIPSKIKNELQVCMCVLT